MYVDVYLSEESACHHIIISTISLHILARTQVWEVRSTAPDNIVVVVDCSILSDRRGRSGSGGVTDLCTIHFYDYLRVKEVDFARSARDARALSRALSSLRLGRLLLTW